VTNETIAGSGRKERSTKMPFGITAYSRADECLYLVECTADEATERECAPTHYSQIWPMVNASSQGTN
jgi:hypothetical protein